MTAVESPGVIECGHCRKPVARLEAVKRLRYRGDALEAQGGSVPIIFTRTLVRGVMLPSCSQECAGVLRRMAQGN